MIGDSIIEGTSNGPIKTFPAALGERLNFDKVTNYGVSGSAYAKVFPQSSLADIHRSMDADADIVLVFGGMNDLLSPLGSPDEEDPLTVFGGLNELYAGLKAKFPGKGDRPPSSGPA